MTYLNNGPDDQVVLRLQARKSFSLTLWIQDPNGHPIDINGCEFTIVMRKRVGSDVVDDSGNLITNYLATTPAPLLGQVRFDIQASDLYHPAGTYDYTITMREGGFSSVLLKGPVELEENTEFESVSASYETDAIVSSLAVRLRERNVIAVRTGQVLTPGTELFTTELRQKLLAVFGAAVADGQTLTADDIADGVNYVMMTMAERDKLANLVLEWDDIDGKPAFGDIITKNEDDFLKPGEVTGEDITSGEVDKDFLPLASGLRGIVITTDTPPGGNPGYIYLKYEE